MYYKSEQHEHVELGIVIPLSHQVQEAAQELNKKIATNIENIPTVTPNISNCYHISLFQGRYPKNELANLTKDLQQLSAAITSLNIEFIPGVANTKLNLFWNIVNNESLQNLHLKVRTIALQHRSGMMQQFEKINAKLGDTNADRIKKQELQTYGALGTGNNYRPHITLYYGAGNNPVVDEKIKNVQTAPLTLMVELSVRLNLFKVQTISILHPSVLYTSKQTN